MTHIRAFITAIAVLSACATAQAAETIHIDKGKTEVQSETALNLRAEIQRQRPDINLNGAVLLGAEVLSTAAAANSAWAALSVGDKVTPWAEVPAAAENRNSEGVSLTSPLQQASDRPLDWSLYLNGPQTLTALDVLIELPPSVPPRPMTPAAAEGNPPPVRHTGYVNTVPGVSVVSEPAIVAAPLPSYFPAVEVVDPFGAFWGGFAFGGLSIIVDPGFGPWGPPPPWFWGAGGWGPGPWGPGGWWAGGGMGGGMGGGWGGGMGGGGGPVWAMGNAPMPMKGLAPLAPGALKHFGPPKTPMGKTLMPGRGKLMPVKGLHQPLNKMGPHRLNKNLLSKHQYNKSRFGKHQLAAHRFNKPQFNKHRLTKHHFSKLHPAGHKVLHRAMMRKTFHRQPLRLAGQRHFQHRNFQHRNFQHRMIRTPMHRQTFRPQYHRSTFGPAMRSMGRPAFGRMR